MTVSLGASGGIVYATGATTTVAPTYPSGITAGQLLVLVLGQKPSTANNGTATTPSGWILAGSLTGAGGYSTTLAADTGNTNLRIYTRTAAGSESGSQSVSLATNSVTWAQIHRFSTDTGLALEASVGTAAKTAGSTSVSQAITSGNMDVRAGDAWLTAMCIPTAVTTPAQFSAENITIADGLSVLSAEISEPDSTGGLGIGGFQAWGRFTAGGNPATAPTVVATAGGTTTNVRGPIALVRIRETQATTKPYIAGQSTGVSGAQFTTINVPVPIGAQTGDIVQIGLYREDQTNPTAIPSGFTLKTIVAVPSGGGQHRHLIYWKRLTAADTGTYAFTWAANIWTGAYATLIRGAATSGDPYDNFAQATSSASGNTMPVPTAFTPSLDDCLILYSATDWESGAWTPPSGYTNRHDRIGAVHLSTSQQGAAASTDSPAATRAGTASTGRTAVVLAVREDPPVGNASATRVTTASSSATASAVAPSTTLPVSDPFTGTNGAAPNPAKWVLGNSNTGHTATIQSDELRHQITSTGANFDASRQGAITLNTATPLDDTDTTFQFRWDTTRPPDFSFQFRCATKALNGAGWYVVCSSGSATDFSLWRGDTLGEVQSANFTFTPGTNYMMRVLVVGNTIRAKVWPSSGSEPAWSTGLDQLYYIDTANLFPSGYQGFSLQTGAAAGTQNMFIDSFSAAVGSGQITLDASAATTANSSAAATRSDAAAATPAQTTAGRSATASVSYPANAAAAVTTATSSATASRRDTGNAAAVTTTNRAAAASRGDVANTAAVTTTDGAATASRLETATSTTSTTSSSTATATRSQAAAATAAATAASAATATRSDDASGAAALTTANRAATASATVPGVGTGLTIATSSASANRADTASAGTAVTTTAAAAAAAVTIALAAFSGTTSASTATLSRSDATDAAAATIAGSGAAATMQLPPANADQPSTAVTSATATRGQVASSVASTTTSRTATASAGLSVAAAATTTSAASASSTVSSPAYAARPTAAAATATGSATYPGTSSTAVTAAASTATATRSDTISSAAAPTTAASAATAVRGQTASAAPAATTAVSTASAVRVGTASAAATTSAPSSASAGRADTTEAAAVTEAVSAAAATRTAYADTTGTTQSVSTATASRSDTALAAAATLASSTATAARLGAVTAAASTTAVSTAVATRGQSAAAAPAVTTASSTAVAVPGGSSGAIGVTSAPSSATASATSPVLAGGVTLASSGATASASSPLNATRTTTTSATATATALAEGGSTGITQANSTATLTVRSPAAAAAPTTAVDWATGSARSPLDATRVTTAVRTASAAVIPPASANSVALSVSRRLATATATGGPMPDAPALIQVTFANPLAAMDAIAVGLEFRNYVVGESTSMSPIYAAQLRYAGVLVPDTSGPGGGPDPSIPGFEVFDGRYAKLAGAVYTGVHDFRAATVLGVSSGSSSGGGGGGGYYAFQVAGAYPLRNTITTDLSAVVRWCGALEPPIGNGYAQGRDRWEQET